MRSPQHQINRSALRADLRRALAEITRRAAPAALFVVVLAGAVIAADTTLTLARDLPEVLARAEAQRGM